MGQTRNLIDAHGLAARVEIPPLFRRRIVLPYLGAVNATAGLERDDERASWRFGGGEREPSPFVLNRVYLENGDIVHRDEQEKTALDSNVKGSLGRQAELAVVARGRFRDEPAKGTARIPSLEPSPATPIQLVANATVGRTRLAAEGTVASGLDTLDLRLKLAGQTLQDLRKVFGMNLPDTPPYRVAGQLRHTGTEWVFEPFDGTMGDSDLQGAATYRTGGKRPLFRANLCSKLLDLDDLGPVIGTPLKTGPGETASAEQKRKAAELAATSKALPRSRTERFPVR